MALTSRILYQATRFVVSIYFRLYHRAEVSGSENIPRDRAVIVACNHASYLDPPLAGYAFYPGILRFIAWDHLFRNPLFGLYLRTVGAIPVSRDSAASSAGLVRLAIGLIKEGKNMFICPEGHRTETGKLEPLEGGVAILALKTGAPVIPTWIGGTFRAMSPSMAFPRPKKLYTVFGEPIYMEKLPPELDERGKRKYILDKIDEFYVKMDKEDKEKYGGNQLPEKFRQAGTD